MDQIALLSLTVALVCVFLSVWQLRLHLWELQKEHDALQQSHDNLDGYVYDLDEGIDAGFVELLEGELTKATPGSACYDVHSAEDCSLFPGEQKAICTGIKTQMFGGVHGLLLDRSGLAVKHRITRRAGMIDGDYPEEWKVVLTNEGRETFIIKKGDRIAQVLFISMGTPRIDNVGGVLNEPEVARTSGFGSTGLDKTKTQTV